MPLVARVQVIPEPGTTGQVAASSPLDLSESDLDPIAEVVNQSVMALQTQITPADAGPKTLGRSEIEVKFGIDLQGETKIPIIGPVLGWGMMSQCEPACCAPWTC